ncbi:MAG: DNA polymerase III subunit delta [Bacteroidales bacterium]|nr:DNA polymerase III subunit delta [Bacteroidales bacterium]
MYFKDVIGQEDIKKKLINNFKNNRVSHAQLFLGPEGSGKLALAIAYARYLACKKPGSEDACGECPSCQKYNKFAHPDLNFFYPIPSKTVNGTPLIGKDFARQWITFLQKSPYLSLNDWYKDIDIENKQGIINARDCTEIVKVLGYKSYESDFKVVVIWMIERLYHAAAPKLLKILEEPPEKTLFLLVSENQDLILNTILSRAQIVKIPRLRDDEVREGLISKYNCDPVKADQIAFLADGNFFQALNMMESEEILENNTDFLREWLRVCYKFDTREILAYVDNLSKMGRERQKTLLSFALEVFRQCNLFNYHAGDLIKIHPDSRDFINKFSTILTPQVAINMTEEFSKAIYHVERNANPKILFTDLSLKSHRIMKAKK